MSEKEIRDKIWRLNNYMKTENPDYFLKPRRLETIKPYYKLPKILL